MTEKWGEIQGKVELIQVTWELSEFELSGSTVCTKIKHSDSYKYVHAQTSAMGPFLVPLRAWVSSGFN